MRLNSPQLSKMSVTVRVIWIDRFDSDSWKEIIVSQHPFLSPSPNERLSGEIVQVHIFQTQGKRRR